MKKKGFTLVELLATIVVLSVIALIATPIILNVIEKAKKGALVSSVNGLVESANMYYTNEIIKGDISEDVIFDFEEGIQTSSEKLSYKGKVYNGKLILTSDSDVITCIDDGKYYAYKEKDSDEVISGIGTCLYDGTTGDFTIESDVDVIQKECDEEKEKLQSKIDELTEQITNLQNQINEKDAAINSLQSNLEANKNEILTLTGEKQVLQEALDSKNTELKELNEKIASVTATSSDVLTGKTILGNDGNLITGTITSLAAKTYTPGTSNQTIASGQYLSGVQTIKGDANLVSANIKSGANIFGVAGNANVVDTSSGDATATQILKGKKAYVDGKLVTGTMVNKSGTTTAATTVTESGDNALITIPTNGYYSTSSKISVPMSELTKTKILYAMTFEQVYNNKYVADGTITGNVTTYTISEDHYYYLVFDYIYSSLKYVLTLTHKDGSIETLLNFDSAQSTYYNIGKYLNAGDQLSINSISGTPGGGSLFIRVMLLY